MAQTARTTVRTEAERTANIAVENTTGNVAELGKRTADQAADAAREAIGTTELGQALIDLVNEQTRHNVELVQALARTVDWNEVARLQSEFVRVSLERAAQLTQRYLEVTQALITSAADAAKDQARKAA